MLESHGIEYSYREYTEQPLSVSEIVEILRMLEVGPHQVLRKNGKAYRELGLTGSEPAEALIVQMASHPTLLQRPIGVFKGKAALGRPPENLLSLLS